MPVSFALSSRIARPSEMEVEKVLDSVTFSGTFGPGLWENIRRERKEPEKQNAKRGKCNGSCLASHRCRLSDWAQVFENDSMGERGVSFFSVPLLFLPLLASSLICLLLFSHTLF